MSSHPSARTSTYQQGAKAGAKAASKEWEEEAPAEGADAKAVADAKEVSRGGAAAAKVRAYMCFVTLGCGECVGLTRVSCRCALQGTKDVAWSKESDYY
jgi:hypothetical protein